MSTQRYIENLTLTQANIAVRRRPVMRGAPEAPAAGALPADLKAAVDAGSLLSFVDGLNAQEKDDVLYSVQLAQRGASGQFDRFAATEDWYRKYTEILENLGWTAEQMAFAKYDQSEGEFRMDQAALAIITAIATQNQLAVLTESIKALGALAEGDGTIQLFDFHTSAQASGNFQIGAVQRAANGAIGLALGAFRYAGTDARRRFLFFRWGSQQVNFWTAAQKMTLNETLYAQHRDAVAAKLGLGARDFIAGLTLG